MPLSIFWLIRVKVDWAAYAFILHRYLIDLNGLSSDGYWNANYQIYVVLNVVLACLLLPTRHILPIFVFQLTTVIGFANWLDQNWYDPPVFVTGDTFVNLRRMMISLTVQVLIIMWIVRLMRIHIEKLLLAQMDLVATLEKRVQERTTQLEAANKDLESFSYSVSHDLHAPLRGINRFAIILKEGYAAYLDESGQQAFQCIIENGNRMAQLIDDGLLEFSRLGQKALNIEVIDPAELIRETLGIPQADLNGREVAFVLADDLPLCLAYPTLLRQVFANLLDNAIKYSRGLENTWVEVNWQEKNGEVLYFVRENGGGV